MDFIDRIQALAAQVPKQIEHIHTEEATKSALVMPFINALGYNVFDPTEVVPEYVADVGVKKGEKVDYAILRNGNPIILFECKSVESELDDAHMSQLFRYFSVTEARIGVLTNGVTYRFYSDLEEPNKMDKRPFLVISMLDIQESLVVELKKMSKDAFDLDEMISRASDLKYTREIRRILDAELESSSPEFVKFFASQVYSGRMTQKSLEVFTDIVNRAFNQFINTKINERLQSAISGTVAAPVQPESPAQQEEVVEQGPLTREDRIETTDEEMEAFYIVKSILHGVVEPNRVTMRDAISYCGIFLDDNNRKPICRFRFNSDKVKYLGLIDENKNEQKQQIEDLNDIFKFAKQLKKTISYYDS